MTRTEDDIRDALQAKADEAATSVELPARHPLRRGLPVVGAVAAAAAVATAVPLVLSHDGKPHPQHAATSSGGGTAVRHLYSVTVRTDSGPPTTVLGDFAGCARATSSCATVEAFSAGAFGASDVVDAVPVTIAGRPGLFGQVTLLCGAPTSSVAYEQSPGRWVVLQGGSPALRTKGAEVRIAQETMSSVADAARSVVGSPDLPTAHKLAYRFGYLPHAVCSEWGVNPTTMPAVYDKASDIGTGSTLLRVDYRSADHRTTLTTQIYGPDALSGNPENPGPNGTPVQAGGGYTARVRGDAISVSVGPYWFYVTYSGPAATHDDLLRIARGLQFPSKIADRPSWFDEATVVP